LQFNSHTSLTRPSTYKEKVLAEKYAEKIKLKKEENRNKIKKRKVEGDLLPLPAY